MSSGKRKVVLDENDAMAETAENGGERVPHSFFSVDDLPAKERFALWRDSISCIFDVDASRETRGERFAASVDAHMLGPLMLARTTTIEQRWERSPSLVARDGMDHYMIQLFEEGHMRARHDHGEVEIPEGGLIVFDLAETVTSRTDNFTNLSLILPRQMVSGILKQPDGQHMRALSGEEPMVALLRDHLLSLKRLAARMTVAQAAETAPATAGLVAACLNGSVEDIPTGETRPTLRDALLIRRSREYIDANLSAPDLAPDMIARAVGVSRAHLYRLFQPQGGVSNYIRDRRLRCALLTLGDPSQRDRPIYDIALDYGFTSNPVFTRSFRQRYGVTPRDVRHGGAVANQNSDTAGHAVDRRYEQWLNRLHA